MNEVFAKGQYALHRDPDQSRVLKVIPVTSDLSLVSELTNVELIEIDEVNRRCRWQISLSSDQLSKDASLALGWLALEFIFEKLQLKKVQVELVSSEAHAIEFHRKLGFCEEGRLVRQVLRDEKFWDVVLMAQFKEAWDKRKKNLEPVLFEGSRV